MGYTLERNLADLERNLADLERHTADFTARKGFTFTVLNRRGLALGTPGPLRTLS